jgi:hypothetical protein
VIERDPENAATVRLGGPSVCAFGQRRLDGFVASGVIEIVTISNRDPVFFLAAGDDPQRIVGQRPL